MKKLLMLFIALSLTLALVACGGCSNHVDESPRDAKCDNCGAAVACAECVDESPKDAKCDVCGKDVECETCVDEDKDAECDVCGEAVECETCVDENKDAECDVCGEAVECAACVDASPKDAKCDVCGKAVPCVTCVDASPKDAKCDVCGKAVPCGECVDVSPLDAKCDVCGKAVPCGECVDEDPKDAKCDVCGKDVPCTVCIDADDDAECDVCGNEIVATELKLLIDGEANFQFVLASGIHIDIRRTVEQNIVRPIKTKCGVEITAVTEGANSDVEQTIEVLVGDVTSRGSDYLFDRYTLGKDGYIIKVVGSKILINAGSDETLVEALEEFAEDILGFDGKNIDFDAKMLSTDSIVEVQDNYKITSLAVNGNNMRGYTIATDTSNTVYKNAALTLQDNIYDRTGYWLKIVSIEEATENSIIIKHIPKVFNDQSFKVSASGTQLIIECAFDNKLTDMVATFVLVTITQGRGDINFSGNILNRDISFVTYEDFDAKGDGKTDDFMAIYNAHVFANEGGQKVIGTPGKTYYIHNTLNSATIPEALTVPIKTDTDWTGVRFIVDDSDLDCSETYQNRMAGQDIFTVTSDYNAFTIDTNDIACPSCGKWVAVDGSSSIGYVNCGACKTTTYKADYEANNFFNTIGLTSIGEAYGTTKIDLGLGYPALLIVQNSSHAIYRRYGADYANRSSDGTGSYAGQHEILLVDAEGNISSETPFMFDYAKITSIVVYRTDVTPITIKGGTVTTKACGLDASYYDSAKDKDVKFGYINRGLSVERSYTIVDGLEHIITGEVTIEQEMQGIQGAHYHGFFSANHANEVTFQNCILQGRRYYSLSGTYDFSATAVNKIVLKNCIQSNFWVDESFNASATQTTKVSMEKVEFTTVDGETKSHVYTWGIGGTNFCKNMEYIDSRLSRFDAHQGLYNGKVIRCDLQAFEIIGKGDFIVEDVNWYTYAANGAASNSVLALRSDYGSTWEGEIFIDGFNLYTTSNTVYLVGHSFKNWDFGYTCHIPSIDISGLKIYDKATGNERRSDQVVVHLYSRSMASEPYMHLETTKATKPYTIQWTCEGECTAADKVHVNEVKDYKCDICGKTGEYKFLTDSTRPYANDNITTPPAYVRVRDNDAGYLFHAVENATNDPNHFLANTKFYVGDSEQELFTGTYQTGDTNCFIFD